MVRRTEEVREISLIRRHMAHARHRSRHPSRIETRARHREEAAAIRAFLRRDRDILHRHIIDELCGEHIADSKRGNRIIGEVSHEIRQHALFRIIGEMLVVAVRHLVPEHASDFVRLVIHLLDGTIVDDDDICCIAARIELIIRNDLPAERQGIVAQHKIAAPDHLLHDDIHHGNRLLIDRAFRRGILCSTREIQLILHDGIVPECKEIRPCALRSCDAADDITEQTAPVSETRLRRRHGKRRSNRHASRQHCCKHLFPES